MRRLFTLFLPLLCVSVAHGAPQFLDDEAERTCDVGFTLQKGTAASFSVLFDYQDAKNSYTLTAAPKSAAFSMTRSGQKRVLATAPVVWKAQNAVVIQRRPWLMRLIVNGQVVLTAFDATFREGPVGIDPSTDPASWKWKDARVQPVEPIRFDDDFTRAGREGDDSWKTDSGKWELTASSENVNARNADMSSNPFAYVASTPNGLAMATTGRHFWDSYDARVAVRPASSGTVGMAAYVQDPKNYLAFEWSGKEGASARKLIRVQNGHTTVLASAMGAFLPRQWYEIGLRTSPGYLEALVDGTPVLRAKDGTFGQGGIGLIAQNMATTSFDDVKVRSYDFLRADFNQNGAWTLPNAPIAQALGITKGIPTWVSPPDTWKLANGAATSMASPKGVSMLMTGASDWDGYRALISSSSVSTGFVVGYRDPANYVSIQSVSKQLNIVQVKDGKRSLLSKTMLPATAGTTTRWQIDADNGALGVRINGNLVAQTGGANLTQGRFGLMSASTTTSFRDAVIYFPPPPDPPTVADKMVDDAYMVGWASPTGEWPPSPGDNGLEFWNTGEFFGDASLEFPWRAAYKGSFEVALRANRGKFDSGYLLRGESTDDKKSVNWTLNRGGKVIGRAAVSLASLPADDVTAAMNFKVALEGSGVLLFAADVPVMSVLEAAPPGGTAMAVRSQGFRVRSERLHAQSTNRDDYTFTGAPIDFYAPQGRWSIFSRWPCYGDWSFFGGTGLAPVLWSKRTYRGDVVAEMYAHPQMILPKEIGYTHPGDLNLSLCGDGKNPSSGYSFVVAGWDNTRSKLLRGNQVIAENAGDEASFHDTINHNPKWHRKWFYIRAEARRARKDGKNGVQLTLTLDDSPILTAFDPNPLPNWQNGGRVAFWTVDSTMMIARAKIEAQNMGGKALPAGLLDATPQVPIIVASSGPIPLRPVSVQVGELDSSLISKEKDGWKITDPASGGAFETTLNALPLTATSKSRFEMDAQIPADVKIDAYVVIDGSRYAIGLTGEQKPDAFAPVIGKMVKSVSTEPGEARYSFNLGEALAKKFPGQTSWKIDALTLGARHGDAYRWLSFGGNPLGASYRLSNLHWTD